MNEIFKNFVNSYGEAYLKKLLIQFAQAKGIKQVDLNSDVFAQDFCNWLNELSHSGEMYVSLLEYMDFGIDSPYYAEIGKGKKDSLFTRTKTTLITPYTKGLHAECGGYIIPGNIDMEDGHMVMNITGGLGYNVSKVDSLNSLFLGMMVHNPYDGFGIWKQILTNPEMSIACGVFGKTSDSDVDIKRKQLEVLRKNVEKCKEESLRINDTYCHVLIATPKKIVKELEYKGVR